VIHGHDTTRGRCGTTFALTIVDLLAIGAVQGAATDAKEEVVPGKRWSDKEKDALQHALQSGIDVKDVQIKGRRPNAIRVQAIRMSLIEPNVSRWNWALRQRRLLKKYWRLGLKPHEIHDNDLLGKPYRSLWSIKKKWGRMKLADRKRARKMRQKKVWKPGEKQEFERYLLENSATMTPEQIGKTWNIARSTVARWQTELGVKKTRDAVMIMEYSLAKQRRARRRIRRTNVKCAEERRVRYEAFLCEEAKTLVARCRNVNERVCTDCGRSWPKRAVFFHSTDKRTDFGTSRYYKRRCRICENARRREQEERKRSLRRTTERAVPPGKVAA
jgi:hypothetical protein